MIISFNPSVFKNENSNIQDNLAKILRSIIKKDIHLIETKSIQEIFYDNINKYCFNENPVAKFFLSENDRRGLKEYLEKNRSNITKLHLQHLTSIVIGLDESKNEINPESASRILEERSKIIVENGINDWDFIKGVCQKYTAHKKRKTIYALIYKSILNEFIEPDNSGGHGEIIKIVKKWMSNHRFEKIFPYKLMVVFDSDREFKNGTITETKYKDKLKFFKKKEKLDAITANDYKYEKSDLIIWHILHKRKLENYIPLTILFSEPCLSEIYNKIPDKESESISISSFIFGKYQANFQNKTPVELDYIEYNFENIGLTGGSIKDIFPKLFLQNFSYQELEKRCEHHKEFSQEANEEISEMEQILLKIAKII